LPPNPKLTIQTARTDREIDDFIDLPWKIYRDDSPWVPPLKDDIRDTLTEKNPFWQHAERELFLAILDGEIVGRVAAVVDENYNKYHGEACGFFGFFESIDNADVARLLIDSAREWLKSRGMNMMRGPASPSLNEECGLLIEGFDDPPAVMMPYNHRYYIALMDAAGLKKAKDLFSYRIDGTDPIPERMARLHDLIGRKKNVRFRSLKEGNWDKDLQTIKEIYKDAWEKNWGFVPMTTAEFDYMVTKLKPVIIPEAVHFIDVKGETVAFSLLLPDVNQVLKKLNGKMGIWGTIKFLYYFRKITRMRLIALGVKKEFRNRGLEAVLYIEAWLISRRKGWYSELGWVLEDNERMVRGMEALEGRLYKKFRIYEQEIHPEN